MEISSHNLPKGQGRSRLVLALDITDRVKAIEALRTSEARYRQLADMLPTAIFVHSEDAIVYGNPAFVKLMGASCEEELLGLSPFTLVHPSSHETFRRRQDEMARVRSAAPGYEMIGLRRDGRPVPVHVVASPVEGYAGSATLVALSDLTERERSAALLRSVLDSVGDAILTMDTRGVVTSANRATERQFGYADTELLGRSVRVLKAEPSRQHPDPHLDDSSWSMVAPRLLDLNELVSESANLLRRLIGEDIALSVLADPGPVRVVIDPGQLEQVLMNLAVNARDAMPTGGRLTIEIREVQLGVGAEPTVPDLPPGRYAALRVTDTGCGMNAELRGKIFEPFFTTKGLGKGTGLGLAVVHGVIQQSGGAVTVESTVGVGTSFRILLPSALAATVANSAGDNSVASEGCETVLVVEDEESVRSLVRVALEGQGYTVLAASSGEDALTMLNTHPGRVDLLVTDVIMPGISGRELAVSARALHSELRVLYMSGYTDDALDRHGLQGTGDQFIQKPFTPLGLARKIRAILDQSD